MGFMSFGFDSCLSADGVSFPAIAQDDTITCGESVWQYTFDDIRLIPFGSEEEIDTDIGNYKRIGNNQVRWMDFLRWC